MKIRKTIDELEDQISEARRSISSDGYPMSLGELTNLYREGELIIRPEFQRFFRWSEIQKSRLVESILLGIPLPSIFVAQTAGGKWELVDGLQRVSTILELQGCLRNAEGKTLPQLILSATKYLPALEGRRWESLANKKDELSLTEAQRLDIKRAKIDIKIIKRESSPETKFDLFQRLNSYGSIANAQEIRSAMLVAVSPEFFAWIERLAKTPEFVACTELSERLIKEKYDLELVLRFLILHNRSEALLKQTALRDFSQVLDDESVDAAQHFPTGRKEFERVFSQTFTTIANNGADLAFKRWDPERNEFRGSFLNTSFEVFGLGLGYHVANKTPHKTNIIEVVREFWSKPSMRSGFATGRSTEARLAEFVPLGRKTLAV